MDDFLVKYPFLKQLWLPLALGFLGLIFFIYGLVSFFNPSTTDSDVVFDTMTQHDSSVKGESQEKDEIEHIFVDVSGAVKNPGVYELPIDSRVKDAIVKSGGMIETADTEIIAKTINFAAKLIDGEKIYIPFVGDAVAENSNTTQSGKININKATGKELDTLAGVGEITAGKIIAGRPYQKVEELVDKKIVSSKVFEQIKEQISVY